MYLQVFAALYSVDSGALKPKALAGLPEALAGLSGFSIARFYQSPAQNAPGDLFEEFKAGLTLGNLGQAADLLDAGAIAYKCDSGLSGSKK